MYKIFTQLLRVVLSCNLEDVVCAVVEHTDRCFYCVNHSYVNKARLHHSSIAALLQDCLDCIHLTWCT